MIRTILAAAVMLAVLALHPQPAAANEAPWCAVSSMGWGTEIWDCSYWSLQACTPYAVAGNRGFCTMNPAYAASPPAKHRKHTVRRR